MLANIYMNRFLKCWRRNGLGWDRRTGKRYLDAGPSAESRQRLEANVHALTTGSTLLGEEV